MERPVAELAECMEPLGGVNMATFSGRLALQKHVYLLQLFGVDLGYRFNWYLHGPYSPALADTGFELDRQRASVEQLVDAAELEPWAVSAIHAYQEWWSSHRPEHVPEELWLEILASLHYLLHVMPRRSVERPSREEVIADLCKRKPAIAKHQEVMESAWKALVEAGLIEHKKVTRP